MKQSLKSCLVEVAVTLMFVCGVATAEEATESGTIQQAAPSSCCVDRVGDANGSGDDEPTIGDAMEIALFVMGSGEAPVCIDEADINQSGGVTPTASDITIQDAAILVDYLFITGPSLGLPDCL